MNNYDKLLETMAVKWVETFDGIMSGLDSHRFAFETAEQAKVCRELLKSLESSGAAMLTHLDGVHAARVQLGVKVLDTIQKAIHHTT